MEHRSLNLQSLAVETFDPDPEFESQLAAEAGSAVTCAACNSACPSTPPCSTCL